MVTFGGHMDTRQEFDYSDSNFFNWDILGVQGPRVEQARKARLGIIMPRNCDSAYFREDFGNMTQAALADAIQVPLNETGKFVSAAWNTQYSIAEFMGHEFHPNIVHKDLDFIYSRLREYAASKGYKESFDITAFSSGFIPKGAGAAVEHFFPSDIAFFYKNKRFSEWTEAMAKSHKVSYEAASLYVMMHEFMHLFGIKGDVDGEMILEEKVNDFADKILKELYSAGTINEKRKVELARIMRQIKKISAKRYGSVYDNYGPKSSVSTKRKNMYSQSEISDIVAELTKEATSMEMTEEGIEDYVTRKLEEMAESEEEVTDENAENKGPKKAKGKTKKAEGKSKSEAKEEGEENQETGEQTETAESDSE